jgi:hypothetical protein
MWFGKKRDKAFDIELRKQMFLYLILGQQKYITAAWQR